jgi:hypothetical protein
MMLGVSEGASRFRTFKTTTTKTTIPRLEEGVNEGMEVFVRWCPRPIMSVIGVTICTLNPKP